MKAFLPPSNPLVYCADLIAPRFEVCWYDSSGLKPALPVSDGVTNDRRFVRATLRFDDEPEPQAWAEA